MEASSKIITKYNEIWFDSEGVLVLKLEAGAEMELEDVKNCFEAYKKLGCGPHNKVLQLIDVTGDGSMTHEGRGYAAREGVNFFIASAVVSNSLAVKLIVNFFNTFYNNLVPFKMFNSEVEARKWLMSFKQKK